MRADGRTGRLDRFEGRIAYDRARVIVPDGRAIQVYTVRVHLVRGTGVTDAEVTAAQDRARASVTTIVNRGYRLPSGDQMHLDVEFTPTAATAHATVRVVAGVDEVGTTGRGPDGQPVTATDQRMWRTDESGAVLTHELLHFLGLADESVDTRRVLLQDPTRSGVNSDTGIMGDAVHRGGATVYPRHLWAIERIADGEHQLPDRQYPANEILQGQPLPVSAIGDPRDLRRQVARHLRVRPERVSRSLGLRDESTAAEVAAAWRDVLASGVITVDGRTAVVHRTDVRMPAVTPTAPSAKPVATDDAPAAAKPEAQAEDVFSRTQNVELGAKESLSTSHQVAGQVTVAAGFGPGYPAVTFGLGVGTGSDLGIKTTLSDTATPATAPTPAHATVSLTLTTDARTTPLRVDMSLSMPELEHTVPHATPQRGRAPGAPADARSADLRGIRPQRVTHLDTAAVRPTSQRDVDALTSLLTASGEATAKGDSLTFSVDAGAPQVTFRGVSAGSSKTASSTAFSSGWSKNNELNVTIGARGRVRSFFRTGGGLTVTLSGQHGGSKELKHSSSRSDDDKLAVYTLSRTVRVASGRGAPQPVEVRTTFSVPIADAAARGLWMPDAVTPANGNAPSVTPGTDTAFDPSKDSFVSAPPDLADQISTGLGLSEKGAGAVAGRFDGDAGKASLHDAATGGATISWQEGGRTHRVTVRADIALTDADDTTASVPSKREESFASKREMTVDSKRGQRFTFGGLLLAASGAPATSALGPDWGRASAQVSAGHQRSVKSSASQALKETRAASGDTPAAYHPTRTTLRVVHESTADANVFQRALAGGRLLGSGPANSRHRAETPNAGRSIPVSGVVVRRPQLDGGAPTSAGGRTLVGAVHDSAFRAVDVAAFGPFAKVERIHGHEVHADVLEAALSKRGDLTRGPGARHRRIWGSGNFSSWGPLTFGTTTRTHALTRSPFTKPGEVTASAVAALASDAGLRTIANAGLGGRSVSTGDMTLTGKLGDLRGSVEVTQRLGNPTFVTSRQDRTLTRGSGEDRSVGTSREWNVGFGGDAMLRAVVPGSKNRFVMQAGLKAGYTYGRSADHSLSTGRSTERSRTGETVVVRFDAERTYAPTLELRRWRWRRGFANPSYTRYEPASVDVELPAAEAAKLLLAHGVALPPALSAHTPAATTSGPTAPSPAPVDTGASAGPSTTASAGPSTAASIPPVGSPDGYEMTPLPRAQPSPGDGAVSTNAPSAPTTRDPLAPYRDDSDAVVGHSTVSAQDLDSMDATWRPRGVGDADRGLIAAEVRRLLTEAPGSGFLRDAIVGPNRVTIPLPGGSFSQRTATIEVTVAHRPDPTDAENRTTLTGEKLSTDRSHGVAGKRSSFHAVDVGADGRLGFNTRADADIDHPGAEIAPQHDVTVFNRRWDKSASEPVSPTVTVTAEHEALEQHHIPVTFDVNVRIHEHVSGAIDAMLPRSITEGTQQNLPPLSFTGSLDILEPQNSPEAIASAPPAPSAKQFRLPAAGAWRPVRWDHTGGDAIRAAVHARLGSLGAERPGDVYDEALRVSISDGSLFAALPRIVSGETFRSDDLIARRGAFRDVRSHVSVSGALVAPSIRLDTTAPETTLKHSIDLGTGTAAGRKQADETGATLQFGMFGETDGGFAFGGFTPSWKVSSSRTGEQGEDVKTSEKITHKGRSFIVDAHLRLKVDAGTSTIVSSDGERRPDEIDVPVVLQVWEQQLGALDLAVPADLTGDAARDADAAREAATAAAREDEARDAREAARGRARDAEDRVERERRAEEDRRATAKAEAKREAEEERERREAEEKRRAEEERERREAEEKRKADEERERREADAKRRAEQERKAEAERKAEQERERREAEEKRKAEEERKAEAERKAAEERERREAEDKRKAEAERERREAERKAEQKRERQEAERKAAEERERCEAEEKRKAEAERKAEADAEAKRKAEAERNELEERQRRHDEDQRRHDDEKAAEDAQTDAEDDSSARDDNGYEADDESDVGRGSDDGDDDRESTSVPDDASVPSVLPILGVPGVPAPAVPAPAISGAPTPPGPGGPPRTAPVDDTDSEYATAPSEQPSDAEYVTAAEPEVDEPPSRPAPPRPRATTPFPVAPPPPSSAPVDGIPDLPSPAAQAFLPSPGDLRDAPQPRAMWIPDAPMSGYVPEEEDEHEDDGVLLPDGTTTGDGSVFDAQAFFDDALAGVSAPAGSAPTR
ncbi:hypothetical protein C1632_03175 [Microbacterium testaceum]|nr:hypothetical protein C1632_03175 [Microbacterium testaceum]